ncbi:nitroreductase family protein [Thermospira aquatica]|uniref:Nitroreductase family protein n=1 Tax=Thermospira aquatica TaxID=2828656 RepID=A0AAX3BDE5_9SPIR|nr:nitroreductase family protein [Thermospira aquatica]URA10135.1 nitroreductase family protein [Thermospira aquatica]
MVSEILEKRRSYRSLDAVSFSDEDVKRLAHAASLMPSCFNNQPWRFIFIRSKKLLEGLKSVYSKGNEWAYRASMVVAVVTRNKDDCQLQGKNYAEFDTGMAVGAMLLLATEMGYVFHPIAGFDTAKAKELLGIPEDMTLITLIICGKKSPTIHPELLEHQIKAEQERPIRKPLEEFAFGDRWGNPL